MARKKPYKPKPFESVGKPNDTSANIYETMLLSPAFMDLSKNQRLLYLYMKAQYYGKRKPGKDFPEMELFQGDDLFYFPMGTAEKYQLYRKANHKAFYDDVHNLESHGFIKTVSNGKTTKRKSIYQFSGEWQNWGGGG